jgi:tetratricopeptide (TPR) repeat protein
VTHSKRYAPSLKIAALLKEKSQANGIGVPATTHGSEDAGDSRTQDPAEESLSELLRQGRLAEAIERLEASLLQGETALLWNDWSTLQTGCGEYAKAEQGYRKALQLDGSHRQSAVNLGILLVSQGKFQEATEALKPHASTLTAEEKKAINDVMAPFLAASQQASSLHPAPSPLPTPRKKYLVVVRAGNSSLHPTWLKGTAERNWDLIVHSYGSECPWSDEEGVEIIRATGPDIVGPKMRAMHSLYGQRRNDFLAYDYVCFADDDLAASIETFNLMFAMCDQFGLELAQPALTHDSYMGSWGITMENSSFLLRYTNFVEVMCPVFSRAFLELCVPTFIENVSGYGLDILWSSWASSPWKIAILDACSLKHTRASFSGQLYKTLAERGVNPDQELIDFIKKWHLVPEAQLIPGQVVVPTAVVNGGVTRNYKRITASEGDGVELMQALLNGFPKELTQNQVQVIKLIGPIIGQILKRHGNGDTDPDRPAIERQQAGAAA